ncbi:MAG TPA: hypothetical protein VN873_04555 [Candidatus Angelobacter sp.]|nr:hypothetical protein [Candidatus Angelobacter sp.]
MNTSELNKILKAAKVPERPEAFWAAFPRRVTARIHWKPAAAGNNPVRRVPTFAWALAALATCLAIGFFIGQRSGRSEARAGTGLLQNEKVIREMLAMFPNRVRAMVQDEHGLNLVLSDKENVPASTPLWVKVCDGKHCFAAVTFSGQEIHVGQRDITVLADPSGKIILAGDDLLWSNGKALLADGKLKIEAKSLAPLVLD